MKNLKLILLTFVVCGIVLSYCALTVNDDELWCEKIELEDGSHIILYHSDKCRKSKPFFASKEKKLDFVQFKYYLFDFCLKEYEIESLCAISQSNIKNRTDNYWIFAEDQSDYDDERRWEELVDLSCRPYECYYSVKGNSLIELDDVFLPPIKQSK